MKTMSSSLKGLLALGVAIAVSPGKAEATSITAGWNNTCAITTAGELYCWGENTYGEVGDNTTTERDTPTVVSGMTSGVTAVAVGEYFSCAIKSGAAYCWGLNSSGQLGDNSTTNASTPQAVSGLTSGVTQIVAGRTNACAVASGDIYCWGSNYYGQLGIGNSLVTYATSPQLVDISTDVGFAATVVQLAASGGDHVCAIVANPSSAQSAYCWGENTFGELGNGTTANQVYSPVGPIEFGSSTAVNQIAIGLENACALSNNAVYCWGQDIIGVGTSFDDYTTPQQITGAGSSVTQVAVGYDDIATIWEDTFYIRGIPHHDWGGESWGGNNGGQLGQGYYTTPASTPGAISWVYSELTAKSSITVGENQMCAIDDGVPYCWGANTNGVLGNGASDSNSYDTPQQVYSTGITW